MCVSGIALAPAGDPLGDLIAPLVPCWLIRPRPNLMRFVVDETEEWP